MRSAPDSIESPARATRPSGGGRDAGAGHRQGRVHDVRRRRPTGDAAIGQAKDTFAAAGRRHRGVPVRGVDGPDAARRSPTSRRARWSTASRRASPASVTIVADGVQSLYAPLAPMVELGTLRRGQPDGGRRAAGRPAVRRVGRRRRDAARRPRACGPPTTSWRRPAVVGPHGPRDRRARAARSRGPSRRSRSSSARLGVALTTLPTGASVLVPTYELADADGVTWSVIAVVDDQLDFAAVG